MTYLPFRAEVLQLRRTGGGPLDADAIEAADQRRSIEVETVAGQLEPIQSRASLLASFAREASPSEPVRTAYAIRWLELGAGIAATGIARSRRRRVVQSVLRARG